MDGFDTLAVEASGLVKRFGGDVALENLDLRVPAGMVYGLLGPNGAGKTTTIRILATLSAPDGGVARVFGHDAVREPAMVRRQVSMTGQHASVDEDLTGRENLVVIARLLGFSRRRAAERASELLATFDLASAADRLVKTWSGGMRRRLDIAASVIVRPRLLFLDEPTTGLDPRSRNQVWEIVRALVAQGTTILLTTQYLDEADQLADRIAVIERGRVIAEGTPGELKASIGTGMLHVRVGDPALRDAAVRTLEHTLGVPVRREIEPIALSARITDADAVAAALAELARARIAVVGYSLGQPSLDEVFLALTGEPVDGAGDGKEMVA